MEIILRVVKIQGKRDLELCGKVQCDTEGNSNKVLSFIYI